MAQTLFIHAHSPIHPGTGQSLGAVDQAIARDKVTGLPYLPGSSLKGALRSKARELKLNDIVTVFGPDTKAEEDGSGAAVFGDANLLFLPVKTEKGLFAFVTTPYILSRFLRDIGTVKPFGSSVGDAVREKNDVIFEDLGKEGIVKDDLLKQAIAALPLPLQDEVKSRAVCVSDESFRLLLEQGLDLVTRVRINEKTNTAADGGLWLEENLPMETILVSLIAALREKKTVEDAITKLTPGPTYLGGHITIGRGRTRLFVGSAQ